MSLIVLTKLSISPETETPVIFFVRSPRATAVYKEFELDRDEQVERDNLP
jgi:hypothetical protein